MIKLPSFEIILNETIKKFNENFNTQPDVAACAPGRVNLIGEHVDYCNGFVLPVALPFYTIIVGKLRNDNLVELITCCEGINENKKIEFNIKNITKGLPKWANYVKGVLYYFAKDVKLQQGFNAVIHSNVPVGGGLSSSAAIEVSTITFLEELYKGMKTLNLTEKALLCQKAEHDFAGMPCGIMDQLISVMGRKNHALLIDCESYETNHIPFKSLEIVILICNSNVRHELSSSEYPTRRKQCTEALNIMGLNSYRSASTMNLKKLDMCDPVLLKRARHVISEINRTIEAGKALTENNFIKMGLLMKDSHFSLRDDFEVSCKELDILVEAANNCIGVLGSRMTGGGFGGCTVTLAYKTHIDDIIKTIKTTYKEKTGKNADFYLCEPSDGARLIDLN